MRVFLLIAAAVVAAASAGNTLPIPKACQATEIPPIKATKWTTNVFTNTTLPSLGMLQRAALNLPTVVQPQNVTTAPEIDRQILALYQSGGALWGGEVNGLAVFVDAASVAARAFQSPLKIINFVIATFDPANFTSTLPAAALKEQLDLFASLVTTVAVFPPAVVEHMAGMSVRFANYSNRVDNVSITVRNVIEGYQLKIEAAKLNFTMNAAERNATIAKYQALIYDVDNITAINNPILQNFLQVSEGPSAVLAKALGVAVTFNDDAAFAASRAMEGYNTTVAPPMRYISLLSARDQILQQQSGAEYQWATACVRVYDAQPPASWSTMRNRLR